MQTFLQNIKRMLFLSLVLGSAHLLKAQVASAGKLVIQYETKPSTESFRAGVTDEDSASLKFKVWFANPQEEKVVVSIRSENGFIFSKVFKDNWYAQVYDLNALEDGSYILEIASRKQRFEKRIFISTDTYTTRKKVLY